MQPLFSVMEVSGGNYQSRLALPSVCHWRISHRFVKPSCEKNPDDTSMGLWDLHSCTCAEPEDTVTLYWATS